MYCRSPHLAATQIRISAGTAVKSTRDSAPQQTKVSQSCLCVCDKGNNCSTYHNARRKYRMNSTSMEVRNSWKRIQVHAEDGLNLLIWRQKTVEAEAFAEHLRRNCQTIVVMHTNDKRACIHSKKKCKTCK